MKTGIRASRKIVSAFGNWAWNLLGAAADVTVTGYGPCRR
jgi:hypothetical protein